MPIDFEIQAQKSRELLLKLATELDISEEQSGRILRSFLHGLRNRLPLNESFHIISQLPMGWKAVYVDGWRPERPFERIRHLGELMEEIRREDGSCAALDFGNDEKMKDVLGSVFRILNYYVSRGEMEDLASSVPEDIRRFIYQALGENKSVL